METIKPLPIDAEEKPITGRTQAIIDKIEIASKQLQDVTADVQAIRKMMQANESWRAALWRAVKQFIGDIANGK